MEAVLPSVIMKRIFWEGVMVDQQMIESLADLVLTQ